MLETLAKHTCRKGMGVKTNEERGAAK